MLREIYIYIYIFFFFTKPLYLSFYVQSVLSEMTSASRCAANSFTRNSRSAEQPLLSSSKMNLTKEKEELQHLNDRFATYINKVKSLEEENKRLKKNAR